MRQVEAVILELGLSKSADTLVGDERVRGVSGGERKRVSVGCVSQSASQSPLPSSLCWS